MLRYLNSINPASILLLPFSAIYWVLHQIHQSLYRLQIFKVHRLGIPVIVIGNVTVGGTGKTPLVIWLADFLVNNGYRPGIISRGYGGHSRKIPRQACNDSQASEVGDEPLLLAQKTGVPVYVGADRAAAGRQLLKENNCDILISDDGLQHFALARDLEIAVVDGWLRFGNGFLLPAGPLRESTRRLHYVDYVVCRGGKTEGNEIAATLQPAGFRNLDSGTQEGIEYFQGKTAHAVAGIGNPDQFFDALLKLGIMVVPHRYPDHHQYTGKEFEFDDEYPVIMTEKDAVKCSNMNDDRLWSLEVSMNLPEKFGTDILMQLQGEKRGQ